MNSPFATGAQVVAYLRDSGHEDQEMSVEQQQSEITAWCLANGLILTHTYIDAAAPGSTTIGRDQFTEMIHLFRTPNCPVVGLVVWKFNRFARDMDDAQFYKADLRRRGYIIHSLHDQVPQGLDGRFFESAIDWMNARYLEDLAADVKRGQRHLITTTGALGGTPPRGFLRESIKLSDHRDGDAHIVHRWTPDPDTLEIIRTAWRMRAQGESYQKINQVTRLYKSTGCYAEFFRNPLYIGIMHYGDQTIENYCEPIIGLPTWHTVQAIQDRAKKAVSTSADHPRRARTTFLLSGLLYCARCGSAMNAENTQFRSTAKYHYQYYTCTGISRHTCSITRLPRAPIENTVLETIAEIILAPDYIEALRQQRIQQTEQIQTALKTERTRITRSLTGTRKQIENLTNLIAQQPNPPRAIIAKLSALEEEETSLLTQRADLEKPLPPIPTIEALTRQAQVMRRILADPTDPRLPAVLHGIIDRITLDVGDADKKIYGNIDYFSPLNAYRASYDAPYGPTFYGYTQCPGTLPKYSQKIVI